MEKEDNMDSLNPNMISILPYNKETTSNKFMQHIKIMRKNNKKVSHD